MKYTRNTECWKGWGNSMRMKYSDEVNKMMEKVEPYLTGEIDPEYKDGTPDEIKKLHKKAIELSDKEYLDATM